MTLEPKNKNKPALSVFALASVVLLLFILFMIASSAITPSGLRVNVSQSDAGRIEFQKVAVTITKDLQYFINDKKVTKGSLEGELKRRLGTEGGAVVLHVDKDVPSGYLVNVVSILKRLEAEVVIATKPI
ncbi:MAG: biopolymer transporter ExbD [Chryseolinea sp.]